MIFEIFKTGAHTNSNGITKNFTEQDLDHIVDSYKPKEREVPLVLGHPKDNDPAYGWVEKLYRKGQSLFAKSKDEDPAFLQAVKDKKFPKRSISLTEDERLNHIGFLGAVLPAVDGLSPVSFNTVDNFSVIEIENFEDKFEDVKNLSDSDSISQNDDVEPSQQTSLNPNMKQNIIPNNDGSTFKEYENILKGISDTLDEVKTFQESISQNFASSSTAELKDSERQKIREQLTNLSMKIDVNNFEVLLNEKLIYGNITPLMKQKISKTLRFINTQNFTEFDSNKFVLELKSQLMDFVNSIPKIVELNEFATKPNEEPEDNLVDDNYDGLAVDESSNSLHKKVLLKMKEKDVLRFCQHQ